MFLRTCGTCKKHFQAKVNKGKCVCPACKKIKKNNKYKSRQAKWDALPPAKCKCCGLTKPRMAYYDPNNPVTCKKCCKKRKKLAKQSILVENHKDKYWFLYLKPEEQRKYARRRYDRTKQATPGWFEKEEVKALYSLAKDINMQVDHIIPLFHPRVCGLHCRDNLQLLSRRSNFEKSNNWDE